MIEALFSNIHGLTLLWLFGVALVAGIIDVMAGGGGLLTLPALMAAGVPPIAAVATNKFQSISGSVSATVHFWRCGRIKLKEHWLPALTAFLGAVGGAACVSLMSPDVLKRGVPFLLILIALWVLLSPSLGKLQRKARLSYEALALTLIPLIGFHGGFIGVGGGILYAMSSVALSGVTLDEATVRTKFYNAMSDTGALILFLFGGHIVWLYGVVMIVGTFLGGNIGARLVLRHGTQLIKPMVVVMSLAMSVKLLW